MDKDALIEEISSLLVRDPKISSRPWDRLVIVAQVLKDSTKVNGFGYTEDGETFPTVPRNLEVLAKLEQLREAMRIPGKDLWRACLIRINRIDERVAFEFEYDNPEKWLINPKNAKQMAEFLKPSNT